MLCIKTKSQAVFCKKMIQRIRTKTNFSFEYDLKSFEKCSFYKKSNFFLNFSSALKTEKMGKKIINL